MIKHLLDSELITDHQLKQINAICKQSGKTQEQVLQELGLTKGNFVTSEQYIDLDKICVSANAAKRIDYSYLKKTVLLPFTVTETEVLVAAHKIIDLQTKDFLQAKFDGKRVKLFLADQHKILEKLALHAQIERLPHTEQIEVNETLAQLLEACVLDKASDLHLEPYDGFTRVRVRRDGLLRQLCILSGPHWMALCVRIKLLANLDISKTMQPQDGRFDMFVLGRQIDLRVSTRPVICGENIVVRILDTTATPPSLIGLGYSDRELSVITSILDEKKGIFIVTGPTNSGKSTLLFAMLKYMNSQSISIATVEDPIEYKEPNFRQTDISVYKSMSFAHALRCVLRQDPDIVSISEIRDDETAGIAVRAAMTGRMLLTTLHCHDIWDVFDRMEDLGVDRKLLIANLSGLAAQRLVRRVCDICQTCGCDACAYTGYNGRFAVCNILRIDQKLKTDLLTHGVNWVKDRAKKTLAKEFLTQIQLGRTCLQEVARVYGSIDDDDNM